jgi:hypothetical protein
VVIAMADDVWTWCEKANARGRTVTVKVKWADFQISTRSRSMEMTIQTREKLHQFALGLIRSVFPPPKGIPFLGSGSTLIAAKNTGRICRGVELDPFYVDVIVRRYEAAICRCPGRPAST